MNNHNNGQGFGIPVFDGFVLTKEWLQMIGIRFALLTTAIKAFLDTELGYAKEPEEAMMSRLVDAQTQLKNLHLLDTQNQLRNLTIILGNYTNHPKHMWHFELQEIQWKRGSVRQTVQWSDVGLHEMAQLKFPPKCP